MFDVTGKRRQSFILMVILSLAMQPSLSFIQQLLTGSFDAPGAMLGTHQLMMDKRDTIPLLLSLVKKLNIELVCLGQKKRGLRKRIKGRS